MPIIGVKIRGRHKWVHIFQTEITLDTTKQSRSLAGVIGILFPIKTSLSQIKSAKY